MATKLWTSSRLITTNLCMVENPLVSIKIYLEHCCNALIKCPHSFWPKKIFTLKDTVAGREGVWPPNSGHHLVSSQQICTWLEILLLLSKTLLSIPSEQCAVSVCVCLWVCVCVFACLCCVCVCVCVVGGGGGREQRRRLCWPL